MANPKLRFKKSDGSEYPDWESIKIVDLFGKIKAGGTPKVSNHEYYNDGQIPFLSISDMTASGKYISDTKKRITKSGLDNSTAWVVPSHSIVLSMYASFGKVGITKIDLAASQAILALCHPHSSNESFLFQLFDYLDSTGYWKEFVNSGTQPNLSATIVKDTCVYIPCLEEQQQIAEYLSYYDEAISAAKSELELWKKLKHGYMQQMLV